MLEIHRLEKGQLVSNVPFGKGSWISLINPTQEELGQVAEYLHIDKNTIDDCLEKKDFKKVILDSNQNFISLGLPSIKKNKYDSSSLQIFWQKDACFTICNNSDYINYYLSNLDVAVNDIETCVATLIFAGMEFTILRLKDLQDSISKKERLLSPTSSNKELLDLLDLENTLVYISMALTRNKTTLEKLLKENIFKNGKIVIEESALLNQEGLDLCSILKETITTSINTYGTIISNNLNKAMKFLAAITIIFSIPTMISSFFGMNVKLGIIAHSPYSFLGICVASLILSLIIGYWLKHKDMF